MQQTWLFKRYIMRLFVHFRSLFSIMLYCLLGTSLAWARPALCDDPWTYRIGKIDERYGINDKDARELIKCAADAWGGIYSCNLFKEHPDGIIVINFVYDERMKTVDTYHEMKERSDISKDKRKELMALLDSQRTVYEKSKALLEQERNIYTSRCLMLDVKTKYANMQARSSEKDRQYLKNEPAALKIIQQNLQAHERTLKQQEERMQKIRALMNDMEQETSRYRQARDTLHETMKKGVKAGTYVRHDRQRSINVYLNYKPKMMTHLLAHELGHVLGISEHTKDPESIMYYAVNSDNIKPTFEDKEALRAAFHGFD